MLVFLLCIVKIEYLFYQLMYLSATDQSVEAFFSLLFLSREELIILFDHLIVCESASHTRGVKCSLEISNKLALTHLAR